MKEELDKKVANIPVVTVVVGEAGGNAATSSKDPVTFELTITAKTGYVLDAGIKGYQQAKNR